MSDWLARLGVDLFANVAGFDSDLGRANRIADKRAKEMAASFGRMGAQIGAALATGITGLSTGVKLAIDRFDKLGDSAKKIGVGVEALSGLSYAAQQSGSSAATLEKGMLALSRTMAAAASGSAEQAEAFRAMGVSLQDAGGNLRSTDEVFLDIADRFKDYRAGAAETALSAKLFGKSAGPELVQLLDEGRKGIVGMTEEAKQFGAVIGVDAVKNAQDFKDNVDKLTVAGQGFFNNLTSQLLPSLVELSGLWVDGAKKAGDQASAFDVIGTALKGVTAGFIILKNTFESIVDLFLVGVDAVKVVGAVFEDVGEDLGAVAAAQVAVLKGDWADAFQIMQARAEDSGQATTAALSRVQAGWEAFKSGIANNQQDVSDALTALFKPMKDLETQSKKTSAEAGKVEAPLVRAGAAANEAGAGMKKAAAATAELGKEIDDLGDPAKELNELLLDQAGILGGTYVQAAIKFRDEMVKIAELERRIYDMGPPTLEQVGAIALARANASTAYRADVQSNADAAAAADARIRASGIESAESWGNAWQNAVADTQASFSDWIASGLTDFDSFGRSLERMSENYLRSIADMFQSTVLTPGGGGFSAFGQQLNQQSMFGQGGTGSTAGGWMAAAGMAYSGWQAAGRGDRWGTVAQFTAAGTSIMPGWGTLIGAVVGLIVAFTRTVHEPQIRLAGAQGTIHRQEGSFDTVFGTIRAGSAAGVKWEQYVDGLKSFDKAIMEMVSSFSGAEPRLQAIRAALATWSVEFENQAASLENVLTSRFDTILSTFEPAIQTFVMGGADLKEQMQRFGDALAAEASFVAAGIDDIDFAQFLEIVEDMSMAGEETGAAVNRIVGGMNLLGAALDVMGVDLEQTGEDFVRFSTAITEAAGGLDQAQALWDRYFQSFFTAEELAQRALGNVTSERDRQLAALGLDADITPAGFRELFEQLLPSLSADAVVQWLHAADAIQDVIDAEGMLNAAREEQARNEQQLAALIEGLQWDDYLSGLSGLEREIAQIHHQFEGYIAQAIALGASEDDLTELRRLEANAIDRLTDATQDSTEAFEDYWATIAQIAADAAAQMLDDLHRAAQQVQAFLNGMALSSTSSLSPQQRLAAARAQFLQLAQLAGQGDTNAMSQLAQAAQQLLQEGRNFFGAGAEFSALEAMVRNLLQPFGAIAGSSDLQGAFALLTEAVHRLTAVLQGNALPATGNLTTGPVAAALFAPTGLALASAAGTTGDAVSVVEAIEQTNMRLDEIAAYVDRGLEKIARSVEVASKDGGRGKNAWG